jgi:hypothetical protein
MAAPIDDLKVPPPIHERAKMLWIATGLGGLCGFIVFKFFWKLDGQDESRWFRRQLVQSAIVGGLGWLCYPLIGLGFIVHLAFGLIAFTALNRGRDYELPLVGRYLP